VPTGLKIGGYYPIHKELDPLPLLASLAARGAVNSLPVMQGEGEPLLFRVWTEGDPTEAGPFGVRQPPAGAALIEPDLILAPMVAFDMSGARVGYGGGYYDKTIAKARASRSVTVVGLAFSAQMVNHIPKQAYDQPMDWIVTELAAHQIKPA
jgi:5-formyltetrahydrofolate cyclo-ligase